MAERKGHHRVVVYEDDHGEFRWRRLAGNNRIVASSGEGYGTRWYATESAASNFPDDELGHEDAGPAEARAAAAELGEVVFGAWEDLPLDDAPAEGEEGDDRAMDTPAGTGPGAALALDPPAQLEVVAAAPLLAVRSTPLLVPFKRLLRQGAKGPDVAGVKRALSRAGYMQWGAFTEVWGTGAATACNRFRRKHGLGAGPYNERVHALLRATPAAGRHGQWAFDATAALLVARYTSRTPEQARRELIVAAWLHGYHMRDAMWYRQFRPMTDMAPPPNVPNVLDCSTFTTWGYRSAHAPDPNGMGYTGWGNSWAQTRHGARVAESGTKPGDIVHYSPNDSHVAGAAPAGRVLSMGSSPGPLLLSRDYRRVSHVTRHRLL